MPSDQELRLSDYKKRVEYAPNTVEKHRLDGWSYIRVHEYGQVACDAYWQMVSDVSFLQVWTTSFDVKRSAGLYARLSGGELPRLNLIAVIDAPKITRDELEAAMTHFAAIGTPDTTLLSNLNSHLKFVGNWGGT